MSEGNYELIYCIVNAGFSGEVMDAARKAGATGGTVINARGTANLDSEKKFHITVQPDKDMVLLLVPEEIKDEVLHAAYKKVGMGTDGNGIAFSVPVNNVVGIKEQKKQPKE